ncbi:MAG: carbonic anhydrase family protein [Gemmatimonadota bacterium]|nr:carbonic anhydrase family protein [Gemmatimonadota bacterium]
MMGTSALGLGVVACAPDVEQASTSTGEEAAQTGPIVPTQNQTSQEALTPDGALGLLREGNRRFVSGSPAQRDLSAQVAATASGQYPFAVILGCIDSRVPVEVVFDQGVGDVFAARVAGNVVNPDLLGSMEFACRLAGANLVLVLGHTSCGAVKGAISQAELGNLTGLVKRIEPAVQAVEGERSVDDEAYVDQVAETNVSLVLEEIRAKSAVLAEMEQAGEISIVGAMYDVATGAVRFL